MAAQYDFQSGVDLSALSSVTQAQLMQAINQIAPLSNVGGIIAQATAPDIASNARFARYVWIDTSAVPYTLKTYQSGAWTASTVGTNAINAATQIVDDTITLAKLKSSGATAAQVLTVNTSKVVAFTNPADVIPSGTLPVASINAVAPANGSFIRKASGAASWVTYDPTDDVDGLLLEKLETGSANQIIAADSGGTAIWKSNNDVSSNFLPAGSNTVGIKLSKLCNNSATSGQVVLSNGSNLIVSSPYYDIFSTNATVVSPSNLDTAGWHGAVAHGRAGVPKLIKLMLRCNDDDTTGDSKYALNDLLDPGLFKDVTTDVSAISFVADSSNLRVWVAPTDIKVILKTTGALSGTLGAATKQKFTPVFYYM